MLQDAKDKAMADEEACPLVGVAGNRADISARQLGPAGLNIWKCTTFILAFLFLASGVRDYVNSRRSVSRQYSYETGFETDWCKFLSRRQRLVAVMAHRYQVNTANE